MNDDTLLSPAARYRDGVRAHRWENDPAQADALAAFDALQQALLRWQPAGNGLVGRFRSLLRERDTQMPQGLYLWGSVGRGKTFLMDLFVASLPAGMALRRHFHQFMGEVHAAL